MVLKNFSLGIDVLKLTNKQPAKRISINIIPFLYTSESKSPSPRFSILPST